MSNKPVESIVEELEGYQEIVEALEKWLDEAIRSLQSVPSKAYTNPTLYLRDGKISAYENVQSKLKSLKDRAMTER